MTDIINFGDFQKTKETVDPLIKIKDLSTDLVMESISKLHTEGYDIRDQDFLMDTAVILNLLTATLCRQCDIEHKYIKELDDLNDLRKK